jgi:hypothetical protein
MSIRDQLEMIELGPRPAGALHVENGPSDTTREVYLFAIGDHAVSLAWDRALAAGGFFQPVPA